MLWKNAFHTVLNAIFQRKLQQQVNAQQPVNPISRHPTTGAFFYTYDKTVVQGHFLDKGGFGSVVKGSALDPDLEELKLTPPRAYKTGNITPTEISYLRNHTEVSIIQSPNNQTVLDMYLYPHTIYSILKNPLTPIDAHKFFFLAAGMIDAVESFHKTGYLHCDIKPSNFGVTENGKVALIDFGLSLHAPTLRVEISPRNKDLYDARGTKGFMHPLIIQNKKNKHPIVYSQSTDAYSLVQSILLIGEHLHFTNLFSYLKSLEKEDFFTLQDVRHILTQQHTELVLKKDMRFILETAPAHLLKSQTLLYATLCPIQIHTDTVFRAIKNKNSTALLLELGQKFLEHHTNTLLMFTNNTEKPFSPFYNQYSYIVNVSRVIKKEDLIEIIESLKVRWVYILDWVRSEFHKKHTNTADQFIETSVFLENFVSIFEEIYNTIILDTLTPTNEDVHSLTNEETLSVSSIFFFTYNKPSSRKLEHIIEKIMYHVTKTTKINSEHGFTLKQIKEFNKIYQLTEEIAPSETALILQRKMLSILEEYIFSEFDFVINEKQFGFGNSEETINKTAKFLIWVLLQAASNPGFFELFFHHTKIKSDQINKAIKNIIHSETSSACSDAAFDQACEGSSSDNMSTCSDVAYEEIDEVMLMEFYVGCGVPPKPPIMPNIALFIEQQMPFLTELKKERPKPSL